MIRSSRGLGIVLSLLALLIASPMSRAQEPNAQEPKQPMVYEGAVGGLRIVEEGQPPAMIHASLDDMKRFREANPHARAANPSSDLSYHGGIGGVGVETAPKVYLVLWGSQWNNNDPSGEAAILQNFYSQVGASPWLNSVTQRSHLGGETSSAGGAHCAAGIPPVEAAIAANQPSSGLRLL